LGLIASRCGVVKFEDDGASEQTWKRFKSKALVVSQFILHILIWQRQSLLFPH
jgi:hypothetical protein